MCKKWIFEIYITDGDVSYFWFDGCWKSVKKEIKNLFQEMKEDNIVFDIHLKRRIA